MLLDEVTTAELEVAPTRRIGVAGWLAAAWLIMVVLVAFLVPLLPLDNLNESVASLARQGPFTDGHVFGGDGNGRDLLSRVAWGTRASLEVSVGAVGAGMLIGGFFGLIAGYFRGRLETVLTGLLDVMLAFPQLVLALALVTFLRGDPNQEGGVRLSTVLVLVIALGIVSTPIIARITRASTLTWAQREFVLASRAQGARSFRILFREVLPNVLPAMFSIALLGVAVVIVAEGGLSLLGLGVELPTPSWGNIIALGRNDLRDAPHIVFIPSIAIFITVLALNYLGDVVRAKFDIRESGL
ncbi:MAG: ABC transporter permease [Acidimicrobiia bacterium]|nr:ABC transporter permease [Acidimicrobiia bacterium]